MSDFFLYTTWNMERLDYAYERLHKGRLQLEERIKKIETTDPLARRFDVGDFGEQRRIVIEKR